MGQLERESFASFSRSFLDPLEESLVYDGLLLSSEVNDDLDWFGPRNRLSKLMSLHLLDLGIYALFVALARVNMEDR